ncbi:MAG: hypothetical protein RIQ70_1527 [Bacteroidota bacterium]|jgi:hypothetical protein
MNLNHAKPSFKGYHAYYKTNLFLCAFTKQKTKP